MNLSVLLRRICLSASLILVGAGTLGMILSFASMTLQSIHDVIAGVAGFVAGSIFVAAGLVSLTLLAVLPDRVDPKKSGSIDLS